MSYKSKKIVTTMITSIALLAVYTLYAIGRGEGGPHSLRSWAVVILVSIGIFVAAQMAVLILFHIALAVTMSAKGNPGSAERDPDWAERELEASMVEDEMDKAIELRSARIGYLCCCVGFVVTLAALALGASAVAGLHFLLGTLVAASLATGVVSLHGYERGIANA